MAPHRHLCGVAGVGHGRSSDTGAARVHAKQESKGSEQPEKRSACSPLSTAD
jgi:hypothetical protein